MDQDTTIIRNGRLTSTGNFSFPGTLTDKDPNQVEGAQTNLHRPEFYQDPGTGAGMQNPRTI